MFPSCSTEHIAAQQPNTSSFLNSSSRKLPPMPYLEEKQDSKMPKRLLWLLDPGTAAQAGPCPIPIPSTWHSPWKMLWKWICPGNFPSRGASLSSCLPQGHLVQAMMVKFVLTPRSVPLRGESELELCSSPGSGDESQSWGNAAQRRNRSSSSPESESSSPYKGEMAVPKLMDTQQNHQQDKKKYPSSFHSHLWGDNREHSCFRGQQKCKAQDTGGFSVKTYISLLN